MSWEIAFHLDTQPEAMRAVRRLVYAAVLAEGGSDGDGRDIELSVGEALANARRHAYEGGVGPIDVEMGFDGTLLTVTVHNGGKPVSPVEVPRRLPEKGTGGRGLYIIGRLMDQVEISRREGGEGTSVRMAKRLT